MKLFSNRNIKEINDLMTSFSLRHYFVVILVASSFFARGGDPATGCTIDGPTPVDRYSSGTYILNGTICSAAANWTTTCGSIVSMDVDGFEVYFDDPTCTSAVIKAYNSSGGVIASKTVTINAVLPLSSGTISNTSQYVNYNWVPAEISCSPATNGNGSYSYLWYYSTDNSTFISTGVTTQNYQPGALTTTTYFRRADYSGYQSATTNVATVNVYPQLFSGTASPSTQTINYNTAPSTFSVSSPTGGTGSYSYQWQYSSSAGGSFSPINAANGTTFNPGTLASTSYYQVQTNSNGAIVYSNIITVNVYPQINAGSLGPDVSVNYNKSPGTLSLSNVSGGNGSYSYQWQSSPDNSFSSPTNVGDGGTTFPVPNLTATTYYHVLVTSNGVSVPSTPVKITVYPQLQAGWIDGGNKLIAKDAPTGTMTNDSYSGGNGTYALQWQSSPDGSSWTNLPSTSINYSQSSLSSKTYYQMVVTSNGVSATTPITVIDVLDPKSVSPGSLNINYNTSPGQLSISGVTGGTGPYSYQWQRSPIASFADPWDEEDATSSTFTPGALTSNTYYRVAVSTDGITAYSHHAFIAVFPQLQPPAITPSTQTINYKKSFSPLTISALPSGGNGSYTYDWRSSSSPEGPFVSTGSTGTSYGSAFILLTETTHYQLWVTSNGVIAKSNIVTVNVLPQLNAGAITPPALSIDYNTSPGRLTLGSVSGGNGTYAYQWQSSSDDTFSSPENVGTGETFFDVPNLTATKYYQVVVTSNGVLKPSQPSVITVYPELQLGTLSPLFQSINYNATPATLALSSVTGGNGTYSYQWESSADNTFNTPTIVGTGSTLVPSRTTTAYYQCKVTSNGAVKTSAIAKVTVYPALSAGNISPAYQEIIPNTHATPMLDDEVSGGNGIYSYQWKQSSDGVNWASIPNANSIYYDPGVIIFNRYFQLDVTSNGITASTPPAVVVTETLGGPGVITTPTLIIDAGMDGGTINATEASEGTCDNFEYEWQTSPDGTTFTGTGIHTQNYSPGVVNASTWYRRKVTCGPQVLYTNVFRIIVQPLSSMTSFNYLRTRDVNRNGVTSRAAADALTNVNDVKQSTQYYDGLGRSIQTVARQASPQLNDMVTVQVYDQYDREVSHLLPYTSVSQTGNIKPSPLVDQRNFNAAQFPSEQYYYGSTKFEDSPLSRTVGTYAPGLSWQGSQRGVASQYLINHHDSDSVQIWTINSAAGSIPVSVGIYASGQLTKTVTTDEDNHKTVEFKDKEGHVILKKVQAVAAPWSGHNGWACTYYVYDDVGNLVLVLPPEAVKYFLKQ